MQKRNTIPLENRVLSAVGKTYSWLRCSRWAATTNSSANRRILPCDADTRGAARKLYCEKFPLNAPQARLAAVQLAMLYEP